MYKRFLAGMLAACLVFGNAMLVSAAEPESAGNETVAEAPQKPEVEGDTQEQYAPEPEDTVPEEPLANSWRYSNGEQIAIEEPEQTGTDEIRTMALGRSVLRGIDVSQWQKEIDWEKVKASGIDFAIIRCGYSRNTVSRDDKQWERNVAECERLGIPYGVYLYSYAQDTEWALSEAEHVLRLVKGHNPQYPIFFDMEDATTEECDLAGIAEVFCNTIEKAGYQAGVYSNLDWWTNLLTDKRFEQWDRWVAQWNITCDYKGNYGLWQYSSKGSVDGIEGNVDMNYFVVESDSASGDNIRSPFFDINPGAWFAPYVEYVSDAGIMTGMTLNRFGYEDILSRGQFVTMLYRMQGEPEVQYSDVFPDVGEGAFYTNAVLWAKLSGAGVVEGYEDGTFGPADEITREDLLLMMYRYANSLGKDVTARDDLSGFSDEKKVSGFSREAVEWAVAAGIIKGDQGKINPQGKANRAECATIMMRYMEL